VKGKNPQPSSLLSSSGIAKRKSKGKVEEGVAEKVEEQVEEEEEY
jgi:hypothetical protein